MVFCKSYLEMASKWLYAIPLESHKHNEARVAMLALKRQFRDPRSVYRTIVIRLPATKPPSDPRGEDRDHPS